MKRLYCLFLCVILLSGCAPTVGTAGETVQFFAMDTVMSITVFDGTQGAAGAAQQLVNRLDAALSRTRADSEISALNDSAGSGEAVALTDEVYQLLLASAELSRRTGGAFDPAIAPVMDAWGFTKKAYRVPDEKNCARC
jgi:thiamine biosynthesis lipoprotein